MLLVEEEVLIWGGKGDRVLWNCFLRLEAVRTGGELEVLLW